MTAIDKMKSILWQTFLRNPFFQVSFSILQRLFPIIQDFSFQIFSLSGKILIILKIIVKGIIIFFIIFLICLRLIKKF